MATIMLIREKSGNFKQLSKSKSLIIPRVQSDDLSFCKKNAISRSQRNFSEAREDESREKVATLLKNMFIYKVCCTKVALILRIVVQTGASLAV